ncbi:hypothetical protein ALP84_100289 [Pseudomonas cichorii]|uniref:Uncharacterized protein n=1 Tax=Pseudomonas cichorii TaxID=36746 RepID=A0A3M4VI65_PSECI|nr:hypothetical protein ALP84_100289 [Pseudomonas cichorii]
MLNGHRSLLKRNACLKPASDGKIVRTDFCSALSPGDILLQRNTGFFSQFSAMRHIASQRRSLSAFANEFAPTWGAIGRRSAREAAQPRSAGTEDSSKGLLLRRWLRSSRGVAPKKLR